VQVFLIDMAMGFFFVRPEYFKVNWSKRGTGPRRKLELACPTLLELTLHFQEVVITIFCSDCSISGDETSGIPKDFPMGTLALQPDITITSLVIVLNQTIRPSAIPGLSNQANDPIVVLCVVE